MPSPMPPTNPYPTITSQYCPSQMPMAEMKKPPTKNAEEAAIAQRGPFASTFVPNSAADRPSMMMPRVNGSALRTPALGLPSRSVDSRAVLNTLHA